MLNVRIKIDVWSKGLDEAVREGIQENLRELFCQLPARRVWHYLKHIRHMRLGPGGTIVKEALKLEASELIEGPEDVIVKGIVCPLMIPKLVCL